MSRLLDNSVPFRKKNVAKNTYNENDTYELGNSRALSDGDEWGKGLKNDQVGSLTDIESRETSIARNIYDKNKPYNDINA